MVTNEEISWISELTKPEREHALTHTFYSYPAKFLSKLPRALISHYTDEGDLVLDPFVGGGTTGVEAMVLNRRFIGYDLNPFAIFISNVKTTFIDPLELKSTLNIILAAMSNFQEPTNEYLEQDDKYCLGSKMAQEINCIATIIAKLKGKSSSIQNFFQLALIHSIKIVGRRDFEIRDNWREASIVPIFKRKSKKMIHQINSIRKHIKFVPEFRLSSNHNMELKNASVDLIVTSPPYKDKDIEYQQIQIQRRTLRRSRRSNVICSILNVQSLSKTDLCWTGKNGMNYWENCGKSLKECYRVLKDEKLAFFWTGFKSSSDYKRFKTQLNAVGFQSLTAIRVTLSDDRVASGRSTHHGRNTGMMSHDFLFIAQKHKQ
ncbi:MAG: DNA methyltransferase [Candidatus Hodarchaeota archaeon]